MRITFVAPVSQSGGSLVLDTYARLLAARGHRVVLVSPPTPSTSRWIRFLGRRSRARSFTAHIDEAGVERRMLNRAREVVDDDVPDADVIVATWWLTAEWVMQLGQGKGSKVYFIQGHEIYPWLPVERARQTYRLPMRKIVISRWLLDIMRIEYGDSAAELIHNGVDHSLFCAPIRGKQRRPTVGLLYSGVSFKGFDRSLEVLHSIQQKLPNLRVLTFGFYRPTVALPSYVEFLEDPPRQSIANIYSSCDVWLTASSSEGFNMPAIEAMACRTPVVASRTGWPAEALVNGFNGACVDIGDFNGLEAETQKLLDLPDLAWRVVSENAISSVRQFSWERATNLFEQALQRAAGHAKPSACDEANDLSPT